MKNWLIFIKERFHPLSHFIMIALFLLVHILLVKKMQLLAANEYQIVALFIGVTLFYFKLRLYDEVKDFELDVIINPTRPLPRGLLNHEDMYRGMAFCIFGEFITFGIMGNHAIVSVLIAILYSLLMYKEFFIKDYIRPHLTTYALMHTIVTILLSLAIFSFLSNLPFFEIIQSHNFIFYAFANWFLFNVFEFGRKSFSKTEERVNVDTYSSLFTRTGAMLLVLSQQLFSMVLIILIPLFANPKTYISFSILLLVILIIGIAYAFKDSEQNAKRFRNMSSIYIILFYLLLIIGIL